MPIFFTIFVMSTSSFTIFNDDNSYIVMERGKFLNIMPFFFDNYFAMSISSFTMQIFKHDNSYIVMERGKFLTTMPFFWQLFCHVYKFLYYADF